MDSASGSVASNAFPAAVASRRHLNFMRTAEKSVLGGLLLPALSLNVQPTTGEPTEPPQ